MRSSINSSDKSKTVQRLDDKLDLYRRVADKQWRIQGAGGHAPPVGGLKKNFCQYINIITKPTAYDGPWKY